MKGLALASALSLAATVFLSPVAKASGFIVIDPAFRNGMAVASIGIVPTPIVRPPVVHPIVRPPVTPPTIMPLPNPHPTLKGGVSYGLHLQSESIKVDINDQVAKTYITQTFQNDTGANLAGTYLFPLPEDTTFSSFSLQIDGKPVEGKILEANEARNQYEAIVRQMVDPGLLEYADYKTVRARIFPIPAHGTKKVELEYTQVLKAENGMLKYRFPLKTEGKEAVPVDEVKVDVKLNSKQGLRTIWSPTHTISSSRNGDNAAKVAFMSHDIVPDKDFLLYYSVSNKDLAANLLTHKNSDEDGYFLLTLTPPVKSAQVVGKDIVLIADTSGSMQGEKMEQAKKALKYIVNALNPEDRFSVVHFSTDVDAFKSKVVPATPENKKAALAFVDDLEARGGTNIGDALHSGTTMLSEVSERPAYLVMMTDGEPTVGQTDIQSLLKSVAPKRDVRVFDFGVGYDVNTKLLNKLAEQHHGTAQYVEPNENLETVLSGFYEKIKSPVLSNVQIAYDGVTVKDVYPREVKDIFAGSQVLLIGKYKAGAKATINLTGKVNGVAKAYSFPLGFAAEESDHTYLPRLWAMRRIGHLTDIAQENGNNKEVVDEIISLSKKYGIISAYTSFLVTDPSENHRLPPASPVATDASMIRVRRQSAAFNSAMPAPMPRGGFAFGAGGGSSSSTVAVHGRLQGATNGIIAGLPMAEKARGGFYNAPREMQIMDDKAIVRDFRSFGDSGKDAVKQAKKVSGMKEIAALDRDEEKSSVVKTVEDKTFYLKDGVWTDSTFSSSSPKAEVIDFGSTKYFELVRANPGISKYLAVGEQVVLIYKGHCYKIEKQREKC